MTHNHNTVTGGFEHLSAAHEHGHNHTAVQHAHVAHQDFEHEHLGEAHIHDHGSPATGQTPPRRTRSTSRSRA
ncbi:MAG TPA: hypothetical protein VLX59_14565 [Acidimicrobiales bacterium]|nr:hypothetical protein [Acidimicrobiales bacterium]